MRVLLCTLFVLFLSLTAAAQTADERLRARRAYQVGMQRFDAGDFEGARRSFEKAYDTLPNPVVLLSIAECQLRESAWKQADATFTRYLHDAPADAPARAEVEAQLRIIHAMPGTLTIESSPSGARLRVDGTPTHEFTPARLTLAPGDHVVELDGPGGEHGTAAFNLGFASELALHVPLEARAPPVSQPAAAEPADHTEQVARLQTEARLGKAARSLAGLALVAGLGVAVLGPLALHKHEQYKHEPTPARREQGVRLARSTDACIGVTAASLVAAGVLFGVRAARRDKVERTAWQWAPLISTRALRLDAQVRF